jgi:hypothetical protein
MMAFACRETSGVENAQRDETFARALALIVFRNHVSKRARHVHSRNKQPEEPQQQCAAREHKAMRRYRCAESLAVLHLRQAHGL